MSEEKMSVVNTFFQSVSNKTTTKNEEADFVERIHTFIDGQKWVSKPLVLSPAICAQNGWRCVNSNLLECVTCGSKLAAIEPKLEIYEAYKAFVEKIAADLKRNHKPHCPWPLSPSSESLVRMIPMPKEDALKVLKENIESFLLHKKSLPQIKEKSHAVLGISEDQVSALCKVAGVSSDDAHQLGVCIVPCAAVGWRLSKSSETREEIYITCKSCQRKVWVKAFHPFVSLDDKILSEDKVETSEMNGATHRVKRLKQEDFDPVDEHRPWCLWVAECVRNGDSSLLNSSAQEESLTSPCGWQIFVKSLLKNVDSASQEKVSNPTKEEYKSARNLLDQWFFNA